jgi:hypothetical protein
MLEGLPPLARHHVDNHKHSRLGKVTAQFNRNVEALVFTTGKGDEIHRKFSHV